MRHAHNTHTDRQIYIHTYITYSLFGATGNGLLLPTEADIEARSAAEAVALVAAAASYISNLTFTADGGMYLFSMINYLS